MIWKNVCLENQMVRRSGDHMVFWSGGYKMYFTWSIRQIHGQWMCGLGDCWYWKMGGVIIGAKTTGAGLCKPSCLRWRMPSVVECGPYVLASNTRICPRKYNQGPRRCAVPWIWQIKESYSQRFLGQNRVWLNQPLPPRLGGPQYCQRKWWSRDLGGCHGSCWQ